MFPIGLLISLFTSNWTWFIVIDLCPWLIVAQGLIIAALSELAKKRGLMGGTHGDH